MKINELDALRRVDPAAGIPDGPLTEQELAGLTRIRTRAAAEQQVALATAPRKPVRRRLVLAGAAATVAVMGASVVVADPFGSTPVTMAATPPLLDRELAKGGPAKAELIALAAKAAQDTTVPGETGAVHTVRTQGWSLWTSVDGDVATSEVVPGQTELTWSSADRSGKSVQKDPKTGKVTDTTTWTAGTYTPQFSYPLPDDPERLLAELEVGHHIKENGPSALIAAISDLNRESAPTPAVRSALLTILSGQRKVVALGPITDRAGRTGPAFAVETDASGLPTRYILIFDPSTGKLLANEEVLTTRAGKLNVRVPSVISYALFE
ncbi:hypothetical protein E1263_02680 [Kribbella antibiotica]|uniref:CU044_5270 family protein n=1 Tax=Kribbella antibiotica TaxID=190195 RepID=A0A4R4ZVU5_9ACTN|nr:CU044_5270 family protein [Kribbella antibiotica]TDD62640.1 hypothetical protein E1263_02680 [Kribbella antibiotica]